MNKKNNNQSVQQYQVVNTASSDHSHYGGMSPKVKKAVNAIRESDSLVADPLGSYTGTPMDGIRPEQDNDDI